MLVMTAYWERVAQLREKLGWSREELARAAELTVSYIYRIEKGQVETPSYRTMQQLAKALHTTIEDLSGEAGNAPAVVVAARPGQETIRQMIQRIMPEADVSEVAREVERFMSKSLDEMRELNEIGERMERLFRRQGGGGSEGEDEDEQAKKRRAQQAREEWHGIEQKELRA